MNGTPRAVRRTSSLAHVAGFTEHRVPLPSTGRWQRVVAIRDRWRIDDEWWRAPVSRRYFELLLEGGELLVVFQDTVSGCWFEQRY